MGVGRWQINVASKVCRVRMKFFSFPGGTVRKVQGNNPANTLALLDVLAATPEEDVAGISSYLRGHTGVVPFRKLALRLLREEGVAKVLFADGIPTYFRDMCDEAREGHLDSRRVPLIRAQILRMIRFGAIEWPGFDYPSYKHYYVPPVSTSAHPSKRSCTDDTPPVATRPLHDHVLLEFATTLQDVALIEHMVDGLDDYGSLVDKHSSSKEDHIRFFNVRTKLERVWARTGLSLTESMITKQDGNKQWHVDGEKVGRLLKRLVDKHTNYKSTGRLKQMLTRWRRKHYDMLPTYLQPGPRGLDSDMPLLKYLESLASVLTPPPRKSVRLQQKQSNPQQQQRNPQQQHSDRQQANDTSDPWYVR